MLTVMCVLGGFLVRHILKNTVPGANPGWGLYKGLATPFSGSEKMIFNGSTIVKIRNSVATLQPSVLFSARRMPAILSKLVRMKSFIFTLAK